MTFKKRRLLIAMSMFVLTAGYAAEPMRMGNYDFSYEMSGVSKVMPVQVFDDGSSTYFQFRAGAPIPAIFVNGPTGLVMVVPEMQGPYARIAGVTGKYVLRIGFGMGQVSYAGERRPQLTRTVTEPIQTQPISQVTNEYATPAASPRDMAMLKASTTATATALKTAFYDDPSPRIALDVNSYATPIKGDLAQFPKTANGSTALVKADETNVPFVVGKASLGPIGRKLVQTQAKAFVGGRVEVVGRDDESSKDGLADSRAKNVVDLLVASGVPRSAITLNTTDKLLGNKQASASSGAQITLYRPSVRTQGVEQPQMGFQEAPITSWKLRATDETVNRVLQRWADEAGWRLIWKSGTEIRVTGDAELVRDGFVSAADYLLVQARSYGYRIKGHAYNNRVLVVTSE